MKQWGAFEASDIRRNGLDIYVNGTVPNFVAEFEQELDSKLAQLVSDTIDVVGHSTTNDLARM